MAILARVGYGSESLQEGLALYAAASGLIQTQNNTRFNKVSTTATLTKHWQKHNFNTITIDALHVWRSNNGGPVSNFYNLVKTVNSPYDGWFKQATGFYQGLANKPELQATVARMGLTLERINQGLLSSKPSRHCVHRSCLTLPLSLTHRRNATTSFRHSSNGCLPSVGLRRFALGCPSWPLEKAGVESSGVKAKKQNAVKVEKNHSIDMAALLNVTA